MNLRFSRPQYTASIVLAAVVVLVTCRPASPERTCAINLSTTSVPDGPVPSGCTVFSISKGDEVFFGGNDDYVTSDSYYWVDPGHAQNHGAVWIGRPNNVQQGVNEKGLAYDANGLPRTDVNPHSGRIPVRGDYTSYPIHILHECATVEEVIAWVNAHEWHSYMHDQMHFADATGDAVVISAGPDGELAFTRKPPGDGFLVSTNFNVANPGNAFSYPCRRYDRAQEMLGRLMEREDKFTAEDAAAVLEAVHQDGGSSWTVASLAADLPRGLIYLYYFHQFDCPLVLSLQEELANPRPPGPLSRLFPDAVRQEAVRRHRRIEARARWCRWAGMAWLALAAGSVIVLIAIPSQGRSRQRFWVPAVIVLGPVGLLAWFIVRRNRPHGSWATALIEALGDIAPTGVAFVAALVAVVLVPAAQVTGLPQALLMLGLPIVIGWFVFHGPLLAPVNGSGYARLLGRRLPHVLVAANVGMGGMSITAMPLVGWSLRTCPIFPFSVWPILFWWAIAAVGAVVGGMLLFFYERWAMREASQAWSVLASGEGEMNTLSWGRLWWWIPLSYATLVGGIAIGLILQHSAAG